MAATSRMDIDNLRQALAPYSGNTILGTYLCGESPLSIKRRRKATWDEAILVVVHRKWFGTPPHQATMEFGIATYDIREARQNRNIFPGPHAKRLLRNVWFMHLRLCKHSHLPQGGAVPENFHFGTTSFVSYSEALDMLQQIWHQPTDEKNPALGYRPVICLTFDYNKTFGEAAPENFDWDPKKMDNTIVVLDAQQIVKDSWITRERKVPLKYILKEFQIEDHDSDNTGNAAAYITIVTFLAALRKELYHQPLTNPSSTPGQFGKSATMSVQEVVHGLMKRPTPAPPFGSTIHCTKCKSDQHVVAECRKRFTCGQCDRSILTWRREDSNTHVEETCSFDSRGVLIPG